MADGTAAGGLGGEAWPAATRLAVGLALAANLLGSGVIFGFAPLQVLLEEDGIFQGLCGKEASVCPERTSQLVLLYTLGSTAAILCGPVGFVVDWAGPVASNALSGGVASLGLALLGAAPPDGLAPLAAGAVLTGFGGAAILMASLPLGFVVPAAAEGPVLSAVNVCFDASSVVFLLVYRLYASLGLSRRALLVGHAAVIATLHLGLVAAWSCGPAQRLRARQAEELKLAAAACQDDAACGAAALAPDAAGGGPLHGLPLRRQLQSWEFRFVLVFFTAQMFRSNFYLGTNKALLEAYGDARTGYAYTQVFAAFLPVSVVCLPLVSASISRGFAFTYLLVTAMGACWNIAALVPYLPAQPVAFAFFTTFRAFLYCIHFVYLCSTFGSRTSGSVHGVVTLLAACANFAIWPCTALAERFPDRGLTMAYVLLLLLCAFPLSLALQLRHRLRAAAPSPAARPAAGAAPAAAAAEKPLAAASAAAAAAAAGAAAAAAPPSPPPPAAPQAAPSAPPQAAAPPTGPPRSPAGARRGALGARCAAGLLGVAAGCGRPRGGAG